MTTIQTLLLITIAISLIVIAVRLKKRKDDEVLQEQERIAKKEKIHEEKLQSAMEANKDTEFHASDRIHGYVKDYEFKWIKVDGGSAPYTRLQDLLDCEELTPEEYENLTSYDRVLRNLRAEVKEKSNKVKGYRKHLDILEGEIIQYSLNKVLVIGDRNHMAIVVRADKDTHDYYVNEVAVAVDVRTTTRRIYKLGSVEGRALFNNEIRGSKLMIDISPELRKLEEVEANIDKYNRHRQALISKDFKFGDSQDTSAYGEYHTAVYDPTLAPKEDEELISEEDVEVKDLFSKTNIEDAPAV